MDPSLLLDPTWWTSERVTAGVTAAAATVAVLQLRSAVADGADRSRPVVTASLREQPHAPGYLNLVITNNGPSAARDLKVTFTPPLPDVDKTKSDKPSMIPTTRTRYADAIPTLAPGQELRNLYYVPDQTDPSRKPPNDEPLPDRFEVHVDYRGRKARRRHKDTFTLDTRTVLAGSLVVPADAPENRLRQATRYLHSIDTALTAIAKPFVRRENKRQYEAMVEREQRHNELADRVLPGRAVARVTSGDPPVQGPPAADDPDPSTLARLPCFVSLAGSRLRLLPARLRRAVGGRGRAERGSGRSS